MIADLTPLAYSLLFSILLIIAIIDYKTMRIPNRLIVIGTSLGIIYRLLQTLYTQDIQSMAQGILGFIVGGSIIAMMMLLSLIVFKKQGMGMGDLKLLAMIGLFVGTQKVFYTIIVGILIAGIYAVIVLIKSKEEIFPFGPFLALGAVVAVMWGESLWKIYLGYIGI